MIIGLTGLAGSGKTTVVAQRLVARHGFKRTRFASPIKAMLATYLRERDVPEDRILRIVDGDLKADPIPEFGGLSMRHAMLTLGTDWGRGMMHEDFWVDCTKDRIASIGADANIVIDDVRRQNERGVVKELGGIIVKVVRPGVERIDHISETDPIAHDYSLLNNSCVTALHRDVDCLVEILSGDNGLRRTG